MIPVQKEGLAGYGLRSAVDEKAQGRRGLWLGPSFESLRRRKRKVSLKNRIEETNEVS